VSRRRCCCTTEGEDYCFCFEINATHGQFCTLECDITNCQFTDSGCDDPVPSWYVTNNYKPNIGPLGPQSFVVATAPPTYQPCDCRTNWCKSVYTWTNANNNFKRQLCFTLGCGGATVPQTTSTGDIGVTRFNAPACPGGAYCGCCGTQTSIIQISYTGYLAAASVSGPCGTVSFEYAAGSGAWFTRFDLYYCWVYAGAGASPCTLTLSKITMTTPNAPQSSNGVDCGAFSSGCETVFDTCTVPSLTGCVPFTGDDAEIYALAGSPPMTLDCRRCQCP
jgi:hypothetical protein